MPSRMKVGDEVHGMSLIQAVEAISVIRGGESRPWGALMKDPPNTGASDQVVEVRGPLCD
jgi:hypothetical protein